MNSIEVGARVKVVDYPSMPNKSFVSPLGRTGTMVRKGAYHEVVFDEPCPVSSDYDEGYFGTNEEPAYFMREELEEL